MLSKTIAIGRLTKDPQVRDVNVNGQTQKVANFSIACDRDFGTGTDFYDVVVWRKQAENVQKFITKGRLVSVEGRFQKRTYTAQTPGGEDYQRDVWEIQADSVGFLDKAPSSGTNSESRSSTPARPNAYTPPAPVEYSDDDLPF